VQSLASLFRPEALAAQQSSWLGGVRLIRPLSLSVMTVGAALAVVAVVVFLSVAQYTRKATAGGVVVPDRGLIRLLPAESGMVLERRVAEGQAVAAGDVLFVLALERPVRSTDAQAQVLRSVDARRQSLQDAARQQQTLSTAQQQALRRRLQALTGELAQADLEASLQRDRLGLARQSLQRLQSLESAQFISPAQVQAKNEELLALQAAAQTVARERAALERERADLEGQLRALPLQTDSAAGAIARELAVLSREAAEVDTDRRLVVRAPQAGTVSAVLAEPGQSVSPASALASLMPQGSSLQAHLFAPSSAVGFVRPGQPVQLRFDTYAYQKYGHRPGRVLQVSRTPLGASELATLALPAAALAEPLFRITVALEDAAPGAEPLALAPGMRLQADVLLDRRRLVEWLFEPLIGLRSRL
jgi:membrane fusion protein